MERKYVSNSWVISNKYEPQMTVLGQGNFGTVLKTNKVNQPDKAIAIKFSQTIKVEDFNQNIKEVVNMTKLRNHRNIIEYYDFNTFCSHDQYSDQITYYVQIAMECADDCLDKILKENQRLGRGLSRESFYNVSFDILLALKFISEQKMAHLDLKPPNVLYFEKDKIFKLTDWAGAIDSRSKRSKTILSNRDLLHSEHYSAPEIILLEDRSKELDFGAADIYSLGITLLECLGIKTQNQIKWKLDKQSHDDYLKTTIFVQLKQIKIIDPQISQLIEGMLAFEPECRCSIDKALNLISRFAIERKNIPIEPEIVILKNIIVGLRNENKLLGDQILSNQKKGVQPEAPIDDVSDLKYYKEKNSKINSGSNQDYENLINSPQYTLVESFENVIKAFKVAEGAFLKKEEREKSRKTLDVAIENSLAIFRLVKEWCKGSKEELFKNTLSQLELNFQIFSLKITATGFEEQIKRYSLILSGKM